MTHAILLLLVLVLGLLLGEVTNREKDLEELRNDRYGHQEIVSDLKESCREKIDWLKSLRERMGKEADV